MESNEALVRRTAVFPKVDALPRPESHPALDNRDGKIHSGERGPDMGRHVIFPLGSVNKQSVAIPDQSGEKGLQVTANVRIRILLNHERGRGVADLKRD